MPPRIPLAPHHLASLRALRVRDPGADADGASYPASGKRAHRAPAVPVSPRRRSVCCPLWAPPHSTWFTSHVRAESAVGVRRAGVHRRAVRRAATAAAAPAPPARPGRRSRRGRSPRRGRAGTKSAGRVTACAVSTPSASVGLTANAARVTGRSGGAATCPAPLLRASRAGAAAVKAAPARCPESCPAERRRPAAYQVTGSATGPRMRASFCQRTSPGSAASRRPGRRARRVARSSSASMRASSGARQW